MNIKNYLEAKYGIRNATTIMHCEAKVFGIPMPLKSGWLAEHGATEITAEVSRRLKSALEKNGTASALNGLRILQTAWIELKKVPGANDAAFLQSKAWKRVRLMALNKYGRRCQCCGASPETGSVLNVDHILPRRLFPEVALSLENLQVLCGDCNEGKGNWDMTDVRPKTVERS